MFKNISGSILNLSKNCRTKRNHLRCKYIIKRWVKLICLSLQLSAQIMSNSLSQIIWLKSNYHLNGKHFLKKSWIYWSQIAINSTRSLQNGTLGVHNNQDFLFCHRCFYIIQIVILINRVKLRLKIWSGKFQFKQLPLSKWLS